MGEPLISIGLAMAFRASSSREQVKIDPMLLNPDGSFNMLAYQEKLRLQHEKDRQDPEYLRTEKWLSDKNKH